MSRKTSDRRVAAAASGVPGGAVYVENQIWGLLPPWIAAVAFFLLGGVAHLAWGAFDRVGLVSAFLGAVTVGLVGLTLWVSRPRHASVRALSATTVALGGLWMVLATSWGWGHGMWWVYPLPAIALCLAWNIKKLLRGAGVDVDGGGQTQWGEVADKVHLLRATVRQQTQVGSVIKVKAELEPGTTQAQAIQEAPVMAGLMRTPPGGTTVTADPDDALGVEVSFMAVDVLKQTIHWPGPSHPGTSIADHPIRLGTYQDDQPVLLALVGERGGKVVSHIMIQGMTGAGKSEVLQEICDEILSRTDTELEYIDTGDKAEQTVGPLLSGLARPPSLTDGDARRHMADLNREIRPRAQHLAARGLREWTKGCGLSFKVVIIDEAGDSIAADKKGFTRLARKARSVGIILVVAQQNFSQRTMPVDARKNFGTGICLGIAEAGDADWVLSEATINGGASPWLWQNFKPGYFHIEDGGIDQRRWVTPARACLTDPDEVKASVEANAVHRWKGAPLELADAVDDDGDEDAGFAPADDPEVDSAQVTEAGYDVPDHLAAEMRGVDPDAPMPEEGMNMDHDFTGGAPAKATTAAMTELDQILAELREEGVREFRRAHVVTKGGLTRCGRSRAWITQELGRRVDRGELARVGDTADGVYTWAEMLAHTQ
ncbi:MAG TPA: hypothetical protein VFX60_19245 [Micromonospora sp.]|nr:hypothetical protein [Micromonospora sp.]